MTTNYIQLSRNNSFRFFLHKIVHNKRLFGIMRERGELLDKVFIG